MLQEQELPTAASENTKMDIKPLIDALQTARQLCEHGVYSEINVDTLPELGAHPLVMAGFLMDAIGNRIRSLDRQRHAVPQSSTGITTEIQRLTELYLSIRGQYYPETSEEEKDIPTWVPESDQSQLRFALGIGIPELITPHNFAWLAYVNRDTHAGFLIEAYNAKIARWQTLLSQSTSMGGLPGEIEDVSRVVPMKQNIADAVKERDQIIQSLQR